MPGQTHTLLLLSAKPGLDDSLAAINRELENYFSSGGNNKGALKLAEEELHRVGGVLRMLSLRGLVVFCAELERQTQDLAHQELTEARRDVIRRALFGLTHFLDSLANGASNATLRLFQEYQDMLQARGVEMAFEEELFFPALDVELPAALLSLPQDPEAATHLRAARMQYQQALLKWLRRDNATDALRGMMAAVRVALACAPQNTQRAFWWVALGLLEVLMRDGLPPELNARRVLSRIDLRMKSAIEGSAFDEEGTISELLYLIARSHAVTETIEQIKGTYALDVYLPETPLLPPGEASARLEEMRVQLRAAEEAWELYVGGKDGAGEHFVQAVARLHELAERLDRNTLQFLCREIFNLAQQVRDSDIAQRVAVDMAAALLLLEGAIEHYRHLESSFHELTRMMVVRLQAALMRKPEDAEQHHALIALSCQLERSRARTLLAKEMQNILQVVEQSLNAFFNNAIQHSELAGLDRLLAQVQGGLRILAQDVGTQLVAALRAVVGRYARGEKPGRAEMSAVATAVSALADFAQGLALGQQPDAASLGRALRELAELPAPTDQAGEPSVSTGIPVRTGGEDPELLGIFLEEMREVMDALRANLEIARQHPDSRESLTVIRRSFHTLKGSSRMVGLTGLGEVAWAVERAMNKWLQDNRPATPELLDMIGDAEVLFQHWVDMLRSGRIAATIDAAWLLTVADCIEHGKPVPWPAVQPAEPPAAAIASQSATGLPTSQSAETTLSIGSTTITNMLFRVATEEAAGHVAALRAQLAAIRDNESHRITHDFMRAAHTLAGVNRTMGFRQIADLAQALEMWLEARMDRPVTEAQLTFIDQVVDRLDAMCRLVREDRQEPSPEHGLIERLQQDHLAEEAGQQVLSPEPLPNFDVPASGRSVPVPSDEASASLEDMPPAGGLGPEAEAAPASSPQATEVASVSVSQKSAEAPAEAAPVWRERTVHDEIDEQLLPVFLEEAQELYPQIGTVLRAWKEQPGDLEQGRLLQRVLHTLKGSARMVGAMRLGELTHLVEDRVERAIAKGEINDALWLELENYQDRIGHAIEQLQRPIPAAGETSRPVQQQAGQTLEIGAERAILAAQLRVRSEVVDRLVNEAGEASVARSRVELELAELRNGVLELTGSVERLRRQLREIEILAESQIQARVSVSSGSAEKFDPLEFDRFTRFQELTRFMNETVHDVQTVQQTLLKNLAEAEAALNVQSRLNRDLQQGLMNIRMVPFASIRERLHRIVRQTAKDLGKRANLELSGTEVELDRSVLEKMTAPFEHLLRNAVAHGLEPPEVREQAGKPPIGEIRLALRQEANEVVFELSDDGAGLDLVRLREKAIGQGLLQPGETISDEQAAQLIFAPGLSTADEVTEIAGRGVGMDVVRSEITALGGRIDVSSERGHGVWFSIHLPLTLVVARVLMVRAGQQVYALPSAMIEHVQQLNPATLEECYRQQYVEWQGSRYPLQHLTHLLGYERRTIESLSHNPVVLLRAGESRIAVHVDELLGNREVVVKNIGPQLARLTGIAGATVSGEGRVILIINPVAFSQRIGVSRRAAVTVEAPEAVRRMPVAMVVDDSLTVRKITSRLLARSGYEVITARDGMEALEQLTETMPDVMLLDVEMPRMDGFELTKQLRQDSRTRSLPIIMITSRTADKHRRYALELGVNVYLGKPYQEEELLAHMTRLIKAAAGRG